VPAVRALPATAECPGFYLQRNDTGEKLPLPEGEQTLLGHRVRRQGDTVEIDGRRVFPGAEPFPGVRLLPLPPGLSPEPRDTRKMTRAGSAPTLGSSLPAPVARQDLADLVFAGLVLPGEHAIALPDGIAVYSVEALALDGDTGWATASTTVAADKPVAAELAVAPFTSGGDAATGTLAVRGRGALSVRITCDGAEVLETRVSGDAVLGFPLRAGRYHAEVTDEHGGSDSVVRRVEEPGRFVSLVRRLALLPAETELAGVRALTVLPSLDAPLHLAGQALAAYQHNCSEQLAARALAAAWLLELGDPEAGSILRAALRTLRKRFVPGAGLRGYDHWDPGGWIAIAATRHLLLAAHVHEDAELRALATAAGEAHGVAFPPRNVSSWDLEDSLAQAMVDPANARPALERARKSLAGASSVSNRRQLCLAAAILLRAGDPDDADLALTAAGLVFGNLRNHRLYSTWDTTAFLPLLGELRSAGVTGGATVEVDGRVMPAAEAAQVGEARSVRVVSGTAVVSYIAEETEDWRAFRTGPEVQVAFSAPPRAGKPFDLRVRVDKYTDGDLIEFCLPPSLARPVAGALARRFQVDLEGRTEVLVPLVALAPAPQGQRIAIVARNMYDELRATPVELRASVAAS
jgi:hypothetical protein